ncbi:hypothetical protein [Hyalangium rubrum]|uniref:Uncharacterized protein n=1 Tax=Hyalangium rubrum TaxID=3103134 RepID=A0ABU5HFS6_9BACT|nr:hypothetical protein [Hyalangium sp. s54d21]MDY7232326.1 hypothetical protein [Hyalangium sp. s54d21]
MPEFVPPAPDQDKTPRSYASEPARHVEYATLPPDVTLKPEGIHFKDNILVVSVATMVFTSLIIFYIPFFNGLLGGAFGGFHAGRMKRALAAAVANSIIVPGILLLAYGVGAPDLLRFFSGLGVGGWLALHVIGTFIGAVSGAYSRPLISDRNMFRYAEVAPRTEKSS